jgi:hypothetical protein
LIKVVELSVKDLVAFTTNSSSALAGHPVTDRWKIVDLVRDPSRPYHGFQGQTQVVHGQSE